MTNTTRPSPFPRRSVSSVAPFTVKRKKINYDTLEPSSSQFSLKSLLYKGDAASASGTCACGSEQLVAERTERIQQLEKELKQATQEQQTWRHKCKLMEKERQEFEDSVKAQCERDKQTMHVEIEVLKEAHMEKVQGMSVALARLQRTVMFLRDQLHQHGIQEAPYNTEDQIGEAPLCKEDAEFIKNAYEAAKQGGDNTSHRLWTSIQATTIALQHELDTLYAWRSSMTGSEADEMEQESTSGNGVSALKKALFGRKTSGRRKA